MVQKVAYDSRHGKGLKILSILSKIVNSTCTSNTSANLLNDICQITCSLYHKKEIIIKVYNIIMNSIKL